MVHVENELATEVKKKDVVSATVILFTRVPVPGRVKKRLSTMLSLEECAELQEALALDAAEKISKVADRLVLCYSDEASGEPDGDGLLRRFFDAAAAACSPDCELVFESQSGADLGERMEHAMGSRLERGDGACILVGSDIPLITGADIRAAAEVLEENDAVFGPGCDGGYWLVGSKMPFPELFCGKSYGEGDVIGDALATCRAHGRAVGLVSCLFDVDTPEDLRLLLGYASNGDERLGSRTMEVARRLLARGR